MSDSLRPLRLQHARLPCPSPSPRVCSNSCPLSRWCHATVSSSVARFSCLQSFPESGSFLMSQLFTTGGQTIRTLVSVSVLPVSIQGWFPLRLTGVCVLTLCCFFFKSSFRFKNGESGYPGLVPYVRGKYSSLSPSSMVIAVGFL